jgi:hypothetical protein
VCIYTILVAPPFLRVLRKGRVRGIKGKRDQGREKRNKHRWYRRSRKREKSE